MEFKTIRQTAALGILSEHRLRLLEKEGKLPGIYTGNRFLVNVDMLKDQLVKACIDGSAELSKQHIHNAEVR